MRKILTLILLVSMSMLATVKAAEFYASISAENFDDESEGVIWVLAPGFHYGWNALPPAENMFSNENSTITLLLDGYDACLGDISVKIGRLSFSAWNFKDETFYYSNEEGALNPVLTASDFTDGMLTLELPIPAGTKPWDSYTDLEADEFRGWTVQVIGSNSAADHECGETYLNLVFGVSEEIAVSNGVADVKQANEIKAYPNPINAGELLKVDAVSFTGKVEVSVINLVGAEVFNGEMNAANIQVATDKFKAGLYHVVVKGEQKTSVQKFVVQ